MQVMNAGWMQYPGPPNGDVTMDLMQPALIGQFVVAASVCYALHITFFKSTMDGKQRVRPAVRDKTAVKQRSERWAI
jgi:hypothetical protein